jgi:hypothetical protein
MQVSLVRDLGPVLLNTVRLAPERAKFQSFLMTRHAANKKTDYHYITDCHHTTKDAAVELLSKHLAAKADKPKDAFKKISPTKKVGRVLVKAKTTSLATMAGVEGKLGGKTIIGVLDTGATSSAVTRSFVTMLQGKGPLVSIQKMSEPLKYKPAHDVIDSNGTETGETDSEDFEITELCRLSLE